MFLLATWQELLLVIIGFVTFVYFWASRKYQFFEKRGIPQAKYTFLLGSNFEIFLRKKTFGQVNDKIYKELKGNKWGGYFQLVSPILIILDPDMIRSIIIKDFNHFHDHFKFQIDEKVNPLTLNLFNLTGERWRTLRHKLVPIFTSGKLKWMFDGAMAKCGNDLSQALDTLPKNVDFNIKEILSRFSTDIIASCAFGIDGQAMKDPNCEFRRMANLILDPPDAYKQFFKSFFAATFPKLFRWTGMKLQTGSVEDFFISITKQGIAHRQRTGEKRPDFLQLLIELKQKGSVAMETSEENEAEVSDEKLDVLEITDELLAAQTFIFFLAGFENTALVIALTCYFLSKDNDIQAAVQREIKQTLLRTGGVITYDALRDMKLLEACVNETLRLHSPAEIIMRVCTKDYETSEGLIKKDEFLVIPVSSLHRDPDYFPDPDKFVPQRFLSPDVDSIIPGTYLPFGDGPRICIAQRFALLQIKLGVCKILEKCTVLPSSKNQEPLTMNPKKMNDILGGVWVKLKDNESSRHD